MLAAKRRPLHPSIRRRQRQGAARDAITARDAALADWMRDFRQIAQVALRDRRQLMQMLGLNAPAARRAARPSSSAVAIAEAPAVETAAPLAESRTLAFEDRNLRSPTARRNRTKLAAVAE